MTASVVSTVLNRENYKDWSFRMKTYFLAEDLWDVVEGTDKETLEGEERKAAKALYAIQNSCGDDTYPLIKDKTTAKAAWRTLSNNFKRDQGPSDDKSENPVGEAYPNTRESALEEGLSVTGGRDESEETVESVETLESNANRIRETFVKHVKSNDWDNAIKILRQHPQAGSYRVSFYGTALHHAIMKRCSVDIIQQLVEFMDNQHLEITVGGYTALNVLIGLSPEKVEVAKCMVKKNPNLLTILPSSDKKALVAIAQANKNGEKMALYLYSLAPPETIKVIDAAQLISDGFRLERFDIAWDLIQRFPKLAMDTDHDKNIPLGALASNRFAFISGSPLSLLEKLIYSGIRINPLINKEKHESEQSHHLISSGMDLFGTLVENLQTPLGIRHIYKKKLMHERVKQFLPLMFKAVRPEGMSYYQETKLQEALYVAAEQGHEEYITQFLRSPSYPVLDVGNEKIQSLFQIAVECRHYNVYKIICEFLQKQDKDGLDKSEYGLHFGELKKVVEYKDNLGNNMLHTVARITPLSQIDHIQGAILQMQREIQWFKEVERIAEPKDCEYVNNDNKTPRKVFKENHKELGKEAEKSMKETATSCTVVGALIVTIMFAAAFTIPGGNDEKTRLPKVFTTFIVSDAISLFSSTTSIIMFLGILTSRYSEYDFHKSLPTKMIIGLFTLLLSIVTMMLVFSCGLYIILDGKSSIVIPSILLAVVPVASFIWMQFPLLKDLSISTFGQGVFDKKQKNLF